MSTRLPLLLASVCDYSLSLRLSQPVPMPDKSNLFNRLELKDHATAAAANADFDHPSNNIGDLGVPNHKLRL